MILHHLNYLTSYKLVIFFRFGFLPEHVTKLGANSSNQFIRVGNP